MRDDVTCFWSSLRACARQGSVRHIATRLPGGGRAATPCCFQTCAHMTARQATHLMGETPH